MIGRMPIHPQLMRYADFLLGDVWKALEQDEKQVGKFSAIEFHSEDSGADRARAISGGVFDSVAVRRAV